MLHEPGVTLRLARFVAETDVNAIPPQAMHLSLIHI